MGEIRPLWDRNYEDIQVHGEPRVIGHVDADGRVHSFAAIDRDWNERIAARQAEIDVAVREGLRRADFHWMMYSGCCAQACLRGSEMYRGFVKHHVLDAWREAHR